jgi:hypothetical protein
MSHESLSEMLARALDAHSVRFRREGGALVLQDAPMSFRGDVQKRATHSNTVMMQVAFATEAAALNGRVIWNVFAGVGANEDEALTNAFMKFLLGPFHVLLSALGNHICAQGTEQWRELTDASGSKWRICDSPLITQGFDDPAAVPFDPLQSELERAFVGLSLAGVHWVEAFFAFLNGERNALDVQLDGKPWAEGNHIVERWDFQPSGGYQSGRCFFVALSA